MVKLLIFNLNLTLFLLCAQGGKELGHLQTDTPIAASPMSRATGGEQDVVVPFRNSLFSFALPQDLTTAITGSAIKVVCPPVRVLIITGGHAFEEDSFFQKFQAMKGITWTHERFPQGAESQLTLEKAPDYDVAVFYDMYQKRIHGGNPGSLCWSKANPRFSCTTLWAPTWIGIDTEKFWGAMPTS